MRVGVTVFAKCAYAGTGLFCLGGCGLDEGGLCGVGLVNGVWVVDVVGCGSGCRVSFRFFIGFLRIPL